jgi:hypothetical protein
MVGWTVVPLLVVFREVLGIEQMLVGHPLPPALEGPVAHADLGTYRVLVAPVQVGAQEGETLFGELPPLQVCGHAAPGGGPHLIGPLRHVHQAQVRAEAPAQVLPADEPGTAPDLTEASGGTLLAHESAQCVRRLVS